MKEGEGISQRIYVSDPQTQTTVWWWPGKEGEGMGGGGSREKNEDIGTSVNNRNKVKNSVFFFLWTIVPMVVMLGAAAAI